jgi:phenylalanine-4-hydroxylase
MILTFFCYRFRKIQLAMSAARKKLPKRLLTYTTVQDYKLYTHIDQAVWRYVMMISIPYFQKHAHDSYINGIDMVGINKERIPKVDDMDEKLDRFGWGAVSVKGFIPPIIFMEFLSRKILPIAVDIRTSKNITYTPAPDIIHEAAGHAPIIADNDYADYLCAYGQIAQKAIESISDAEHYEVVRKLSATKDNPNADPHVLKEIETEFKNLSKKKIWLSEASELARMNWWTIEYGLVGSLSDPKIYGAGLLSSVAESYTSLKKNVKKLPISIDCIKQAYNITEPQPQLYVTKNFKILKSILKDYSKNMAFNSGGHKAIEKAILSKNVTTTLLDSGLQISGILKECLYNSGNELSYVNYKGGIQLSYSNSQLKNHSKENHQNGYGMAIGKVKPFNKPIHLLNKNESASIRIIEGENISIEFVSGLFVSGCINKILLKEGKPIIISLIDASVKLEKKYLFKPEWGNYDLSCGGNIISIAGGPADWDNYNNNYNNTKEKRYQSSNLTEKNAYLNQLYGQVQKLKQEKASNKNYIKILNEIYNSYPDEWLLCMNIYEIIFKDISLKREIEILATYLKNFKKNNQISDAINRGMKLVESSN